MSDGTAPAEAVVASPAAPGEEPFYLDVGGTPMLCQLTIPPQGHAPRTTAVLLCPPFGWDDMCSYRSRRTWAQELAARGCPSLRIELPGSGDSAAGPELAGLLDAWTDGVGIAAGWLRASTASLRVAAIGIGLGGLLAWRAAAAGAAIDDLVLWGVPAQGRTLVRELRAFARFEAELLEDDGGGDGAEDPAADGGLASGGFRMRGETVAALERLDLSALPLPAAETRRVLLLGRDGVAADRRLRETLELAGVHVAIAGGEGYGAMLAKPQVALPPLAVFALTGDWLDEREALAIAAAAPTPTFVQPAPVGATMQHAVATHPHADLAEAGAAIREAPFAVERPFGRLRGILTEPPPGAARAQLCAVLLNPGAQRRIGPNRMWVQIARRWAARGVPVLRLDVAGIGDSDGATLSSEDDGTLYVPAFIDDVEAALDALVARGLPPRFLLLGLCSGAYWAFHTAARDERVVSVTMLNPRALVWDEHLGAARDARRLRKLGQARTWRKIVRRDASLTSPLVIARALATRPFDAGARRQARRGSGSELERLLAQLDARGVDVTIGFSGSEPLHEELKRDGQLARMSRARNVTVETLAHGPETHTLIPPALQRRAHALVDGTFERALPEPAQGPQRS